MTFEKSAHTSGTGERKAVMRQTAGQHVPTRVLFHEHPSRFALGSVHTPVFPRDGPLPPPDLGHATCDDSERFPSLSSWTAASPLSSRLTHSSRPQGLLLWWASLGQCTGHQLKDRGCTSHCFSVRARSRPFQLPALRTVSVTAHSSHPAPPAALLSTP